MKPARRLLMLLMPSWGRAVEDPQPFNGGFVRAVKALPQRVGTSRDT